MPLDLRAAQDFIEAEQIGNHVALLFFNSHSQETLKNFIADLRKKNYKPNHFTHYPLIGKSEANYPSTIPGGVDNNSVRQLLLVVLHPRSSPRM